MTEPFYASHAPVFSVDGQVRGELARDLLRLDVEEGTDGLKTMRALYVAIGPASGKDEALLYLDGDLLDFGRTLEVVLGPPGEERIVFTGRVSALEAGFEEGTTPKVTAFAEDELMRLRMTRRTKTYEGVSDADIASSIAREHGLDSDVAADGPTYDVVQQWNQSDLAFLRERARLLEAEIWCEERRLNFKTRPNRGGTSLTLVNGNHLIGVRLRADLAHQRSTVRVTGYDATSRSVIDEEAGGEAIAAEIAGGRTGPAVLEPALGECTSHRVREAPLASREARDWARAEMLRRCRAFVVVSGVTRGSPDMVVGSTLALEGVGPPFEGDGYYVTRVHHSYDLTSGHRTRFDAERATINQP